MTLAFVAGRRLGLGCKLRLRIQLQGEVAERLQLPAVACLEARLVSLVLAQPKDALFIVQPLRTLSAFSPQQELNRSALWVVSIYCIFEVI